MAYSIFNTVAEFKEAVGKAVNATIELSELTPTMEIAAEAYILPWLGTEQWGDLVNAVETNTTYTAAQTALLPHVRRVLGLFTMYEYTAIGEVQVSDAGIFRMETDDRKTAYKAQVNAYRHYCIQHGYAMLERMLIFMEANSVNYPLWTASPENKRNREALINTARFFQALYSTNMNRYVMETLRGLMLSIEEFALVPLLGAPFFEEIKAAILAKTVSTAQQTVINLAAKAVANFTIEEGIRRNLVANTGLAVIVVERTAEQANQTETSPTADALRLALRHFDEFGNRHISSLKQFLADHREEYPTYDTWKTEQETAAAEAAEEAAALAATTDACGWTRPVTQTQSIIRL